MRMQTLAIAAVCALLADCSTPQFVKLDSSGKVDPSANPETFQRDLADCEVVQTHVRVEQGTVFNHSAARAALDNCMRSKGYVKS